MYLQRTIDSELDELFAGLPAIALDGAKGVGKTATATARATSVLNLDSAQQRSAVLASPQSILSRPRPLLIDEWQLAPEVWDVVRRSVDNDRSGGQFLLTGSATPRHNAPAHSGAGRIVRLRMRPMTLVERGVAPGGISLAALLSGANTEITGWSSLQLTDYVEEICATGLPGLRGLTPRLLRAQLDGYLQNIVDRDIPEQGLEVRKPETLASWMRAYAAATATTANYSEILDAATAGISDKPTRITTNNYRDILTQLWILDPVPAWTASGSQLNRLGQTAKHHLMDPGLAARLLGLNPESLLDGEGKVIGPQQGTMLGHLFESLVTLCVRVAAQSAESDVFHLRTRNGDHEVDLLVVRPDGRVIAIEVKLAGAVGEKDGKHLRWLKQQLGDRLIDSIIINTGPAAYRRPDGIAVIPLALLGP